ncbi:BACON domain-containing protein [Segatella copri]|nr:BACON domain-containing protein [Segatella copri]
MKKIKHLMIWIGLLLSLVSCKDAMETIGLGGDEIPAEGVTLNIELPNFSEKKINTRAGADESISKVTAVFYGESNTYKGMANVNIGSKNADGTYQATISKVPSGTKTVHLVTNINDLTEEEAKDLQAAYREIDTNNPICWGSVSLETLLNGTPTVDLFRPYAKVTLKVADAVNAVKAVFPEKDAGLIINHTAAKSAIAPAGYNEPTDALAPTTEFSSTDVGDGTSREVAVTETSAGEANVIIKAKYKDVVGYYKVGLYKDTKNKIQYSLLRNHNYIITVTKVNDYGFEKLDDAVKSDPENRLEVNVVDDNPAIYNMIACKDYELGVSDNLSLKATDTKARITLVTTLESAKYDVNFKKDSWIKGYTPDDNVITTPESGRLSSSGKKYLLEFTLDPNIHETPRTETVTISSGDLKLDVMITQAGYDFMRDDPKRKVSMLKNDSEIHPDYFAWLDKDVKGIKPEQMQNVKRNDGLHFTVGKNAYSYKIPKKTGDKLTVDNLTGDVLTDKDGHFTVSADGDYWKVTLADKHDNNYNLWKGTFTIKNAAGINITYTVYHTGIFHEITENMANKYELAEGGVDSLKVKGMFYYGVVKVKGKAHTYIMLDRNLGATDNSPYVPDVNELKDHKGAIGGYFKISEDKNKSDVKQGNLSSTLSPEGFEIPEKSVFEDLIANGTLKTEVRHTVLGESYYCTFMNTTSSELKTIYLPYGGYLEGESHKYPMHVVFWTKTLVSGTQGFSGGSPEYGYWYNYFDVYNDKKGFSNVRFVSGSNGNNTHRYKAMPLRLISKTVLKNPTL